MSLSINLYLNITSRTIGSFNSFFLNSTDLIISWSYWEENLTIFELFGVCELIALGECVCELIALGDTIISSYSIIKM